MNLGAAMAVGIGAALGAWLRWGFGTWLNAHFPTLPLGTLSANLVGGYLVGLAVAFFSQHPGLSPELRLFVITGFLGGLPRTSLPRRDLVAETVLVLLVSLGASALWSLLSLIRKLTEPVALGAQTTTMNNSVTPDRPWLDLAYQLVGVGLGVVPALLAVHLLTRDDPRARTLIGADRTRLGHNLAAGLGLAAVVGIPGLGLYLVARALDLNTTIAPANLAGAWWTVPVLCLAALQNAVLEEVVMVGYLLTRWRQAGWSM